MLLIAALAASVWNMPSGQAALKPSADRLPAPQVVMPWQVPSGLPATKPRVTPNAAPVCQNAGVQKTDMVAKGSQPGSHELSKEPSADELKALLYTEGGCSKPIIVRERVGN